MCAYRYTDLDATFAATSVRSREVATMALTEKVIANIEPKTTKSWYSDEKGLRLLVTPSGGFYWRMSYRFEGKQKTLAIGVYPEVNLKKARLARDEARLMISKGIDPSQERKAASRERSGDVGNRFSVMAEKWWNHQKGIWTQNHADWVLRRLASNTFSSLDGKAFEEIGPRDICEVIRQIEARGALDLASRVLQDVRRVFSFAVREGVLKFNPASELRPKDIIQPYIARHIPSMKNNELGQFLVQLDQYKELRIRARHRIQLALLLQVHTFLRPGELRGAEWSEFNFDDSMWCIPGHRMKMNVTHLVPLSTQVLEILKQLKEQTGNYKLVFPSERDRFSPMSDNTLRKAMFALGYDGKHSGKSRAAPHGFRANASSILNEKGFNPDAIERQLSHHERNGVRAAYMYHAQYLDERRKMMQWWSDYLDQARASAASFL